MTKSKAQGILVLFALAAFILFVIIGAILQLIADNWTIIISIIGSVVGVYLLYLLYVELYFRGKKFQSLKSSIQEYVKNSNDLNDYIEELKGSYVSIESNNYGSGNMVDNSTYNYQRKEWKNNSDNAQTYQCSASVCKSASNQPMKYLCKYFNINKNEESLIKFEKILNDFSSVEQGKELVTKERDSILDKISSGIPFIIKRFHHDRLMKSLGFESLDISDSYFPTFTFLYVSSGGNSSSKCVIKLDIDNLNILVNYLNDEIKWRKSVAGQRALMTSKLRNEIKERDNYSCQSCGNGTSIEPNLLLEIDHIIPVSKGGITANENLQTLCWKCNRSKGSKILTESE